MSFLYGQRHVAELESAKRQGQRFGVKAHEVVELSAWGDLVAGASALLQKSPLEVPQHEDPGGTSIPVTYVPARNTLFLSYALGYAEVLDAQEIWIGVNSVDYSGYPDCRPEFIYAYEAMANLATKAAVGGQELKIRAPLMTLSKAEIIRCGHALGVDYADTVSCYHPHPRPDRPRSDGAAGEAWPSVLACGACDSCQLRKAGFEAAGLEDPTLYVESARG